MYYAHKYWLFLIDNEIWIERMELLNNPINKLPV